jgi:precorrin-6B methylase 2
MNKISLLLAVVLLCTAAGPHGGWAQETPPDSTEKGAPYVPTSEHVVRKMLELADVTADDVVYDLGSGDGRIVIMAAKQFGARGVGVEIDSQLVRKARRNARRAGVADRVEFRQGDLFETDLGEATVVTLYLWPDMNNRLRPKLQRELDPGDRVVSNSFDIDGWEADSTRSLGKSGLTTPTKPLFLWTIPDPAETP